MTNSTAKIQFPSLQQKHVYFCSKLHTFVPKLHNKPGLQVCSVFLTLSQKSNIDHNTPNCICAYCWRVFTFHLWSVVTGHIFLRACYLIIAVSCQPKNGWKYVWWHDEPQQIFDNTWYRTVDTEHQRNEDLVNLKSEEGLCSIHTSHPAWGSSRNA